jgi:membrane fusion protein (multidrug efflux system)
MTRVNDDRAADKKPEDRPDRPGRGENGAENEDSDQKGGSGKNEDSDNKDQSDKKDGGQSKPPMSPQKKRRIILILILIAVFGAGVGIFIWLDTRNWESTDDAFIEGHVIQVSPKVGAIVSVVHIDDNYRVTRGELLVELDPRDYEAALVQAQGDYESAAGRLLEAQSQIAVSKANLGQAQADLVVTQTSAANALRDFERYQSLEDRARSKQQLDNATTAKETTSAQVEASQARVVAAQAQLDDAHVAVQTAEGNLKTAQGNLDQAKNNIGYCKIYADSDGVITRKSVEPGIYVQIDQPLFSIVRPDVWVVANLKETQLARVAPGQSVDLTVDAYPGRKITGKVQSIQAGTGSAFSLLPPENATGNYVKVVQRVPVKIILDEHQNDDADHLLAPGMSVEPDIRVR